MRRRGRLAAAAAVGLALAGCGDETGAVLRAGVGEVVARVRPAPEGTAAAAPATLTREDIEAAGRPALRLRLAGSARSSLFQAVAENGGVTSYATQLREIVGLRGSQVVSTRGFGTDLLRGWSSPNDPLERATPVAQWPEQVTRSYEFPGVGARGVIEEFVCGFTIGEAATVPILGREHRGIEVTETCRGPAGEFQNLHFADARTGFVWRSLQWTGPRQGLIDIEIIVPAR